MLPHVLQKKMLDGVESSRNSFKERQDLLEQILCSERQKLPNIQNQLAVVSKAVEELFKTQDHLIAELSRRIVKDDERPEEARAKDGPVEAEDLPALEKKYGWLKTQDKHVKDMIAMAKQDMFEQAASNLGDQRKNLSEIGHASPTQQQQILGELRYVQSVFPNYRTVFEKYLGDYPELHKAIRKADKTLAMTISETEQHIQRAKDKDQASKESDEPGDVGSAPVDLSELIERGLPFIERSIARKTVITVNDIVVAYEHQYDSIQNLIRGFNKPEAIQKQITELLTANPDADLVPLESALGIKVISVQRKGKDKKPPVGGIHIGSDE